MRNCHTFVPDSRGSRMTQSVCLLELLFLLLLLLLLLAVITYDLCASFVVHLSLSRLSYRERINGSLRH